MFFFFQAEDGIRDVAVTGVQTCALPISKEFLGFSRNFRLAQPPTEATTRTSLSSHLRYLRVARSTEDPHFEQSRRMVRKCRCSFSKIGWLDGIRRFRYTEGLIRPRKIRSK